MKTRNLLLASLLLVGCDMTVKVGETEPFGTLVSIDALSTSWNEVPKSRVVTTEGFMFVVGFPSGRIGAPVSINREWVCVADRCAGRMR